MALTLNDGFLALFVVLLSALAVSNGVESYNEQDQTLGRRFFAVIFGMFAFGLIIYKIANR